MRTLIALLCGIFFATSAYCGDFVLESSAFSDKGKIPVLYSCDGKGVSPELHWKSAPDNTKAFALILTSIDSPVGVFYNWVIFNIPATLNRLSEGANRDLPDGIAVGNNNFEEASYSGPCPVDSNTHHYVFSLYALDTSLDLIDGASIRSVLAAIKKHTLKQADLTGEFSH